MNKIRKLNEELPEFFLESLEERLETDPMSIGSIIDLTDSSMGTNSCTGYRYCEYYNGCYGVTSCHEYDL